LEVDSPFHRTPNAICQKRDAKVASLAQQTALLWNLKKTPNLASFARNGPSSKSLTTAVFRGPCYEYIAEDDILGIADAIEKVARHHAV
jgi:hypothetical protein